MDSYTGVRHDLVQILTLMQIKGDLARADRATWWTFKIRGFEKVPDRQAKIRPTLKGSFRFATTFNTVQTTQLNPKCDQPVKQVHLGA